MTIPEIEPISLDRFAGLSSHEGPWNDVLHESKSFVVLPTLGMLTEGWLLVVPKRWCLNFGYLTDSEQEDYESLKDYLFGFFRTCYTTPTIFEHGPAQRKSTVGCGVDHAHRHFVPLQFNLAEEAIKQIEGNWSSHAGCDTELAEFALKREPYIHIEQDGKSWIAKGREFEGQALRRVIAKRTHQPDFWDWKQHYFESRISQTALLFREWAGRNYREE